MRADRAMRACVYCQVKTDEARASRSVRTPSQMVTFKARLLRAIHAAHGRLLSDFGAKVCLIGLATALGLLFILCNMYNATRVDEGRKC